MTIYEELLTRVGNGERFSINLAKRNMKVGNEYLIKEGMCEPGRIVYNRLLIPEKERIEQLYKNFKYSCPSERSDTSRGYFKAYTADELSDAEMVLGGNREHCRAALEGYILCAVLMNHLKWSDLTDRTYYWQSENDKDLVILRNWIEGR